MSVAAPPTEPLVPATAPAPAAPVAAVAPPRPRPGEDGLPGRTRIDARVVQKVAAQAAREVAGVTASTVDGTTAAVHEDAVSLGLRVCIAWPRPVRSTADALARHVATRVEQLCGRPVLRVDVRVEGLGVDRAAEPRVR